LSKTTQAYADVVVNNFITQSLARNRSASETPKQKVRSTTVKYTDIQNNSSLELILNLSPRSGIMPSCSGGGARMGVDCDRSGRRSGRGRNDVANGLEMCGAVELKAIARQTKERQLQG